MIVVGFVLFVALVLAWLAAPNGQPARVESPEPAFAAGEATA
jgi:hypothetical protein